MTTAAADKLVTFRLGDDHFAADIVAVERVLRYAAPTGVPDMPAYIEGVMDYQGRVVPVVNLRRPSSCRPRPPAARRVSSCSTSAANGSVSSSMA